MAVNVGDEEIVQGNTNFITCPMPTIHGGLYGDGSHIGDLHGLEVTKYISILIDGKEVSLSDEDLYTWNAINGREFRMIRISDIYQSGVNTNLMSSHYPKLDTNGNPIVLYEHFMECVITSDNDVIITNRINFLI